MRKFLKSILITNSGLVIVLSRHPNTPVYTYKNMMIKGVILRDKRDLKSWNVELVVSKYLHSLEIHVKLTNKRTKYKQKVHIGNIGSLR